MGWRTGVPPGENWLLPQGDADRAERLPDKCTIRLQNPVASCACSRPVAAGGDHHRSTTPMGWGIEGSAGIPSTPSVGPGRSTDVRGDEGWQCQACRRAGPRTNPVDRDGGDRWLPKTVRAVGGQQDLLSDARTICPLMASSSRSVLASGTAALAGAGHRLALWRYPAASYAM
jgi:hypothetical protein